MTKCAYEKWLVDYLDENLPPEKYLQMKTHLKTCSTCKAKHHDFQKVHDILVKRRRANPPKTLLNLYQGNLKREFVLESRFVGIKKNMISIYHLFFDAQPLSIRITKTIALLWVGILIGRLVFQPIRKHEQPVVKPEILLLSMTPTDVKLMTDFLIESEIWLLAVVNTPSDEKIETSDLLFNKEIAQKLLVRASFMKEKKRQLNLVTLTKFLDRLEFLLLEVANTSDERMMDVSNDVKQAIENTTLLYESKRLREMLETPTDDA